jgi:hypothetical protein
VTASFIHKGSHESKDSDEELKAMLRGSKNGWPGSNHDLRRELPGRGYLAESMQAASLVTQDPGLATGRQQFIPDRPAPVRLPVMFQNWYRISFLHWPCEPSLLQACLPVGLVIDTSSRRAGLASPRSIL